MMKSFPYVFLCVILLISCGEQVIELTPDVEETITSARTPTVGDPTAPSYPEPESSPVVKWPDNAAITYQRSGGFAGITEVWTISVNGNILSGTGEEWHVPTQQVTDLFIEIENLGFLALKDRYVPMNTCCDRFTYELSYVVGEVRHTVVFLEANPEVPQALMDIQEAVSLFIKTATAGQEYPYPPPLEP